jgi:hypothetical protein
MDWWSELIFDNFQCSFLISLNVIWWFWKLSWLDTTSQLYCVHFMPFVWRQSKHDLSQTYAWYCSENVFGPFNCGPKPGLLEMLFLLKYSSVTPISSLPHCQQWCEFDEISATLEHCPQKSLSLCSEDWGLKFTIFPNKNSSKRQFNSGELQPSLCELQAPLAHRVATSKAHFPGLQVGKHDSSAMVGNLREGNPGSPG